MSIVKKNFLVGEYEGYISWGLPNGYGFMKYKDGSTYNGEWKFGLHNGKGTFTSIDGNITISGIFISGKLHGNYIMNNKSKGYESRVNFENNKIQKDFSIKQENGIEAKVQELDQSFSQLKYTDDMMFSVISVKNQGVYEGQVGLTPDKELFVPQGFGSSTVKYSESFSSKYIGEWNQGKKNGYGTLIDNYGGGYTGNWKDDQFHGKGRFVMCCNQKKVLSIFEGEYSENIPLRGKIQFNLSNITMGTEMYGNEMFGIDIKKSITFSPEFPFYRIHSILTAEAHHKKTGENMTFDNMPPLIKIDKYITISDVSPDGTPRGEGIVVVFINTNEYADITAHHINFDDGSSIPEDEITLEFKDEYFQELNPHLDQ